jgi:hypothetical protein
LNAAIARPNTRFGRRAPSSARTKRNDEQKAQAIILARLKKLGWEKTDLGVRRKSDPQKVALAKALRSETTMSLKWIARRLEMGCMDSRLQSPSPIEEAICVESED